MAYEIKEFPPLSWSFSRMRMLQECPRKYFYNYYGYHNGWLADADEESKQIYRLKNLQAIDAFFGQIFHDTVKDVVRNNKKELMVSDSFRRLMNRTIKLAYQESRSSLDDWLAHPKWYCMIKEVYYDGDILQEKKDAIAQKINITSHNLFSNKSFKELTENNVEIIELDELKSFEYNGITAYLKIDALYRSGTKYVLADWKTSAYDSVKDIDQLILYTWYANKVLGIELEDIEARLEYVQQDKVETYTFGEKELELIDKRLAIDIKLINKYLVNPDTNEPLPIKDFHQVKGSPLCKWCNFKELC